MKLCTGPVPCESGPHKGGPVGEAIAGRAGVFVFGPPLPTCNGCLGASEGGFSISAAVCLPAGFGVVVMVVVMVVRARDVGWCEYLKRV